MMRVLATLRPLWSIIAILSLLVALPLLLLKVLHASWALPIALTIAASSLLIGAAPRATAHHAIQVTSPARGRWMAMNSPGQQLPSHGTRALGQYGAVDITHASTSHTPPLVRRGWRGSAPAEFPTFGAAIHAMAPGRVIRVHSRASDHRARNTWQAIITMTTVEGFLRSLLGSRALLGNHVIIAQADGTFAVYAHLRQHSATVPEGAHVDAGEKIGEVGNTGNSSVPHLHVHLMDRANPNAAAGLKMSWSDISLTGQIDPVFGELAKTPADTAEAAMPRNGEIFLAGTDAGNHPGG